MCCSPLVDKVLGRPVVERAGVVDDVLECGGPQHQRVLRAQLERRAARPPVLHQPARRAGSHRVFLLHVPHAEQQAQPPVAHAHLHSTNTTNSITIYTSALCPDDERGSAPRHNIPKKQYIIDVLLAARILNNIQINY